MRSGVLQRDRP